MGKILEQVAGQILKAGSFVLPEVSLSFYSDKEPVLLTPPKRIPVEACQVIGSVLRIQSGGKPLLFAINPDDTLIDELENGDISALMTVIPIEEDYVREIPEDALRKAWLYNVYAHKVFGAFLKAADNLLVEQHGHHRHVRNCPIQARVYRGKPYANVEEDCRECMFCIDMSEKNMVACTGRERLATPEDFKRTLPERQVLYDEFLEPDKVGLVAKGICPLCGYTLEEKKGQAGPFLGCSQYPFCHFTAERQEDGFLSFNF